MSVDEAGPIAPTSGSIELGGLHRSLPGNEPIDERLEEITVLAPGMSPWFTVVVPTRNERDNVTPFLSRLRASLGDIVAEVLFVDDSTDGTDEVIRDVGRHSGLAVRLLHRPAGDRSGGLGGAVVAGLRSSRGTWAVVMDGDLQHPPELAQRLVAIGQARDVDLVAASRKLEDGRSEGLSGAYRHAMSGLATLSAKVLFPRRLSRLSDPMSGFFAVRMSALDLTDLHPIGFKILLEIAVRQPNMLVAEVPFEFGIRGDGESKASAGEGLRYLRHLSRLRFDVLKMQVKKSSTQSRSVRLRRLISFGLVGVSGMFVNTVALWLFSDKLWDNHYLWAAILATEVSTTWNFVFTETLVFRGKEARKALRSSGEILSAEQHRTSTQASTTRSSRRLARYQPVHRERLHPGTHVPHSIPHCRFGNLRTAGRCP